MGPTLVRLACRARKAAGNPGRVLAAARFSDPATRNAVIEAGAEAIVVDLLEPGAVERLPEVPNVVHMVGNKFGTRDDQAKTWALNTMVAADIFRRYRHSRIVVFSTGNVYPLSPATSRGPAEGDPVGPVGEYAQSALARERLAGFASRAWGTRMAILRINYAVEPRYGVLHDVARRVLAGEPVDLRMGYVNVIWQRDANAIALRALLDCASPPFVVNVTGPRQAVRDIADRFARRFGRPAFFQGEEAHTALLSDATLAERLYGAPTLDLDGMVERVAAWMEAGGRSLKLPTHFEEREGRF
jgi:nucleoside-diphosphate-sugar epimerase